MLVARLTAFLW
ncbi:hypothetical protein D030_2811A, partial [Vibrio parahaemolyticus AQ3810]